MRMTRRKVNPRRILALLAIAAVVVGIIAALAGASNANDSIAADTDKSGTEQTIIPTKQAFATVGLLPVATSEQTPEPEAVVEYKSLGEFTLTAYCPCVRCCGEWSAEHSCKDAMDNYQAAIAQGVNNDSAGYMAPQGLRNILIISATPYQWKHMINQRVCRRNTAETRYVMLKIWEELYALSPALFSCGPFCMNGGCKEGKMACGAPLAAGMTATDIIEADFPLLAGGADNG